MFHKLLLVWKKVSTFAPTKERNTEKRTRKNRKSITQMLIDSYWGTTSKMLMMFHICTKTFVNRWLSVYVRLEEEIWQEFCDNPDRLAFESERLIAQLSQKSIEESLNIGIDNLPQGLEREAVVKQRVSQSFFRSAVISSYNHRCCISGITLPSLLEACHIVAWSDDKLNRTNPKNGLCMNSFFHKAYAKHLLVISPDMKIVISEKLRTASCEQSFASYISNLNGKKILLPDKFLPQRELLAFRYDNFTKHQYDE